MNPQPHDYEQVQEASRMGGEQPITDALRSQGMAKDPSTFHWLSWRVGRKLGRTIYAQVGSEPSDEDVLIGVMDAPRIAREAVAAHNAVLRNVQQWAGGEHEGE